MSTRRKAGLKLAQGERKLLSEGTVNVQEGVKETIRATPPNEPVNLSIRTWEQVRRRLENKARESQNRALLKEMGRLVPRITALLEAQMEDRERATRSAIIELISRLLSERGDDKPLPSKVREGDLSITLTEKQRELIVHATRLRRALKNRIKALGPGTADVRFTESELDEMASELSVAVPFAPAPYGKRLKTVLEKVQRALDAFDETKHGE